MDKPKPHREKPKQCFYALRDHGETFHFKIGITAEHPSVRAKITSHQTGRDFRPFCYAMVPDARPVETTAKRFLVDYRLGDTEFLAIPEDKLLLLFDMLAAFGADVVFVEDPEPGLLMPSEITKSAQLMRGSPSDELILHALDIADGPLNNREIAFALRRSEGTISRRLKALEASGQIFRLRRGREILTFPIEHVSKECPVLESGSVNEVDPLGHVRLI